MTSLRVALLAKFPPFDNRWPPEAQLAWFDAFVWLIDATESWRRTRPQPERAEAALALASQPATEGD